LWWRNGTIDLTEEAPESLVKNGCDEAVGARPMAQAIQTQIKAPLAEVFSWLRGGGVVKDASSR
jgi:ATP-dependent Clp protease ATP-binding subunit ClpA